jgi:hypothetical protein
MHVLAVILIACSGAAYCLASLQRWRALARPAEESGRPTLMWAGFFLLSAALVLALCDPSARDFLYVVLGVWAGFSALLFASRFIADPSRGLLVLPIGAAALVVAMASIAAPPERLRSGSAISLVHGGFMSVYLAALLVAGSAGVLYIISARQLKSASPRAFRLPALPALDRLISRAVVVATAALMAGVATAGVAMQQAPGARLTQPAILLGLVNLALLVLLLAARLGHRIGQRGQAAGAAWCLILGFIELGWVLVARHG